jgi:hypothetical protein
MSGGLEKSNNSKDKYNIQGDTNVMTVLEKGGVTYSWGPHDVFIDVAIDELSLKRKNR